MSTIGDVLRHKHGLGPEPEPTYWCGSEIKNCDVCSRPIRDVAYDARIPGTGTWGILGEECFTRYRCELGTGKGQKYTQQSDDRWLKVEG